MATTTTAWRATPTAAGIARAASLPSTGLVSPAAFDPRYTESGLLSQPRPAVATTSFTGVAAGGAPGSYFGPPGVAGAPVPTAGLSPLALILGALAIAGVLYVVTS